MRIYTKTEEYFDEISTHLVNLKDKSKELELHEYICKQFFRLTKLIEQISNENFWEVLPKVLGIDSQLSLILELASCDDLSSKEIINISENDYKSFYKELSGYKLNEEPKPSLIFNVI